MKEIVEKAAKRFCEEAIKTMRENIQRSGRSASGKAADSLKWKWEEGKLIIYSEMDGEFNYFVTLQTGRGPTRNRSNRQPTLQERIEEWITQKGINNPNISKNSLAFLIARKIHREGTNLYRKGGDKEIWGFIDDEYVAKNLLRPIEREIKREIEKEIAV